MKLISAFSLLLICTLLLSTSCKNEKDQPKEAKGQKHSVDATTDDGNKTKNRSQSPRKDASGEIEGISVKIDYGSPSVRERKIWGGLEDYDAVWRAGANETTSMEFSEDVLINGEHLPQGKYGFFIIPKKEGDWTIIFNQEWSREEHNSWGAYNYHKDKDVLRVDITPEWSEDLQETLEYSVGSDHIMFTWEYVRLRIPVEGV